MWKIVMLLCFSIALHFPLSAFHVSSAQCGVKVKPADNIMLNITGGGMINATKKGFHLKEADLVLSPDLPAEEIIAKVNKLFK